MLRWHLFSAATIFVGLVPQHAFAQFQVSWLAPTTGSWHEAFRWSSDPAVPNNGTPAGSTYAVTLGVVGAPHTIRVDAPVTVSSIFISSPDAQLQVTNSATLSGGTVTLSDSSIQLSGGRLLNTAIVGTGSILASNASENRAVNMSLGVPLTYQNLTVTGGLQLLPGGSLMTPADGNNTLTFRDNNIVSGSGTINLDSGGIAVVRTFGSSFAEFMVGSDITINAARPGNGDIVGDGGSVIFQNYGALHVHRPGRSLRIQGMQWFNFGSFEVSAGTLDLGGSFHTEFLGDLRQSGTGQILFNGFINGAVTPFEANAVTCDRLLGRNAFFTTGTLITRDGKRFVADGSTVRNSTLDGLMQGSVSVEGTFTLKEGSVVESGLSSSAGVSILGTGRVNGLYSNADSGLSQMLIGPGIMVSGDARASALGPVVAIINNGLIESPGTNLSVGMQSQAGTFVNNGTIRVAGGSVLNLLNNVQNNGTIIVDHATLASSGQYSLADFDAMHFSQGSLSIGGTFHASGQQIVSTANRRISLAGSIYGGTFSAEPGQVLGAGASPRLQDVTLAGPMVQDSPQATAALTVFGSLTLLPGGSVNLPNGRIFLNDVGAKITGAGTVTVLDRNSNNTALQGAEFSIDPQITVKAAPVGTTTILGTWVNNGILLNDSSTSRLRLNGNWQNNGAIQATAGTVELMGTFSSAGLGGLNAASTAFVRLAGTVDNTGRTLDLSSAGTPWTFSAARITGGTLTSAAAVPIAPLNSIETRLTNLTLATDLSPINRSVWLDNVLLDDVTLRTAGSSPVIQLRGTNQILGNGTIVLGGVNPSLLRATSSSPLIISPGIKVIVDGDVPSFPGTDVNGSLTLREAVVIVTSTGTITNNNQLRIENSATLRIPSSFRLINNAQLSGAGVLDAITVNNGRIDPDGPLALLDFLKAATLSDTSELHFDIAGTLRGIGHDAVNFSQPFELRGALTAAFTGQFSPALGMSFDLINAPAISGTFSSITLPPLPADLHWYSADVSATGAIRIVPEPAAGLAACAAAMACRRARRAGNNS